MLIPRQTVPALAVDTHHGRFALAAETPGRGTVTSRGRAGKRSESPRQRQKSVTLA